MTRPRAAIGLRIPATVSRAGHARLVIAFALALAPTRTLWAAPAEPDTTQLEAARKSYEDALEAEVRGDFAEAQQKLERAAGVKLTAAVRFHLGLCDERQNRLVSALSRYEAARDHARAEGKTEVANVAESAAARLRVIVPVVTLRIAGPARDGAVTLDGRDVAPALFDTAIRVEPGAHRIEVRRPGYRSFVEAWDAPSGEVRIVDAILTPDAPASTAADAGGAATSEKRAKIALGVGASFAVLGTGSFLVASALASDGRSECATSERPTCTSNAGLIRALDVGAISFWALGAASLGTSAYFFLRPTPSDSAPNRVSSEWRWSPAGFVYVRAF